MKITRIRQPLGRGLWLTCCCLVACSGGSDQTTVPKEVPPAQSAKPTVASAAVQNPLADMVKAVSIRSEAQFVELRFALVARPQAGQPVEIKLNLLGLMDAAELQVDVTTDSGLQIIDGAKANFTALKVGESLSHSLSLRGTDPGIFVADVRLVGTVEGGGPRTMNYAIPIAFAPVTVNHAGDSVTAASGTVPER